MQIYTIYSLKEMDDYQNTFIIKCNTSFKFRLKGEWNTSMCDIFPFKINNGNDVLLIIFISTKFANFSSSLVS